MDSAALTSLTPLLDGIDRWVELAPLLPVIISLELVLSADNAVALATITKTLKQKDLQSLALNIGISISLFLRMLLIIFSQYLLNYKLINLFCGIYLIFLCLKNINSIKKSNTTITNSNKYNQNRFSLLRVVLMLSVTDLAFSIDSITAAVSISDQLFLVITGALIGVLALRFTSSLFVRWLDVFLRLELAGYIAIGLIGLKLIVKLVYPLVYIPEYLVFLSMTLLFMWGFSLKNEKYINE
ncbi:TerC family protein [Prochlorococcus sp. MIT 1223]|uniref:TerC family protein n=1 Tax=Prochlorococcus sp. MIT 1223 TaxID=3096217 RepID=UPI002A752DF8|nr:hypothetical protein [Prochlorococcus sp. MIT 1223]